MNCHRSKCRRSTGSAFKPYAGIARNELHDAKCEDKRTDFWRRACVADVR
ncbi:hypothetical protein [Cupriavidus sp. Marseille-Q8015]